VNRLIGNSHANARSGLEADINRWDGTQVGARDLTWSYASFVSAIRARRQSIAK
jgi:glucoamylase